MMKSFGVNSQYYRTGSQWGKKNTVQFYMTLNETEYE